MSPPRAAAAVGVVILPRPRAPSSRGGLASWAGGGGGLRRGLKIRQGPRYWNLARGVVARHGSPPGSPNGSIHQHTRAHTAGGYSGPASTRASHTHAYQKTNASQTHRQTLGTRPWVHGQRSDHRSWQQRRRQHSEFCTSVQPSVALGVGKAHTHARAACFQRANAFIPPWRTARKPMRARPPKKKSRDSPLADARRGQDALQPVDIAHRVVGARHLVPVQVLEQY